MRDRLFYTVAKNSSPFLSPQCASVFEIVLNSPPPKVAVATAPSRFPRNILGRTVLHRLVRNVGKLRVIANQPMIKWRDAAPSLMNELPRISCQDGY